jgi:hypothetical protein
MPNTNTTQILNSGMLGALAISKEATFGTAVTGTNFLPYESHNIAYSFKPFQAHPVRKTFGMPKPVAGNGIVGGTITTYVDVDTIGPLLKGAMGADSVNGTAPYTHTFTLGGPLDSYTISVDDGFNEVQSYQGCKFSSLDISCKTDDFLMVKANVVGQSVTVVPTTSLSHTFSSANLLNWNHMFATPLGTGASTLSGVQIGVSDFQLNLKTNMKPTYGSTGGRFAVGINDLERTVSGSFTINYDSNTADTINKVLWGSNTGATAGTIATVPLVFTLQESANAGITFNLGAILIEDAVVVRKRNDTMTQTVKFTAGETATGSNDDLKILLTNSATTAY